MDNSLLNSLVTIATAIIGVAILALIVSRNSDTSGVIQAATAGFGQDLQVALSPVTGSGYGGSLANPVHFG